MSSQCLIDYYSGVLITVLQGWHYRKSTKARAFVCRFYRSRGVIRLKISSTAVINCANLVHDRL